jgi:hypothetical protein
LSHEFGLLVFENVQSEMKVAARPLLVTVRVRVCSSGSSGS